MVTEAWPHIQDIIAHNPPTGLACKPNHQLAGWAFKLEDDNKENKL